MLRCGMADAEQGHGLDASAGNCQDCGCDDDVIEYRGDSFCCRCLANRGTLITNLSEGDQTRQRSRAAQIDAIAAQSRADDGAARLVEQAAKDAKAAASLALPRRQIDQARLLRRTRGVASV